MRFRQARGLVCGLVALGVLAACPGVATSRDDAPEPEGRLVAQREADDTYLYVAPAQAVVMSLDQLAAIYDTPAKVWYLLEHTVTYTFDRHAYGADEYFASAEELWARKRGDCEDYAILAKALLDRNGYTTVLFSAWHAAHDASGNDGHTVVAFLERGRWNHLSNLGYVRAEALTHEELAASIFPDWTRVNPWYFTGFARTRDGLNGWQSAPMVANRGAGMRTLVRAESPYGRGPLSTSGQ
jgi:predicted transglutaminase-like cysteine proteinase